MRNYIFTPKELEAIEEFIKTRKRNPRINKLLFHVKHNQRLFTDAMLFIELYRIAHHKPEKTKPKMMPGRPPKTMRGLV